LAGVDAGTLRKWEERYAFPSPARTTGGQRRYSEEELADVRAVVRARNEGQSVGSAVARVRGARVLTGRTLFAAMRGQPGMGAVQMRRRVLLRLSRAFEDETMSRAEGAFVYGSFQDEASYREAEHRWHALAALTDAAVVVASFAELREQGGVIEVPVSALEPEAREWAFLCEAPTCSICIAGWELPSAEEHEDPNDTCFEVMWSADPAVVRRATLVALARLGDVTYRLPAHVREIAAAPAPARPADARAAIELTHRVVRYFTELDGL
jgi:DICT domain-containing protein